MCVFPNCQSVFLSNHFNVCLNNYLNTTYIGVLRLIWSLKVPLDRGLGGHLASHLTGDAAQFEAFIGHSLCVWVHLHTGSMAKRHYRMKRMRRQLEAPAIMFYCSLATCRSQGSELRAIAGHHSLFHIPVTWKGWYAGNALVFPVS